MSCFEPRVNLLEGDTDILICPGCSGKLTFDGHHGTANRNGKRPLRSGTLRCACGRAWPMTAGVPRLVEPRTISGPDWLLRPIYDFVAPSHDLGVDFFLPLVQFPDPGASRDRYMRALEINKLGRTTPRRILEVGIGAGANLPLLQHYLPADDIDEIWGVDLSAGMLLQCALRAELLYAERRLRLVMADAHQLPFADATFDRVFHVGGINGYRDVARGLAEMARVAKPGTPIVVVDEELDPKRNHTPFHRMAFDAITWFDKNPHVPLEALPKGATDVEVSRVSRFYYCLKFRMADAPAWDPRAAMRAAREEARQQRRRNPKARREQVRKEREARYQAALAARAQAAPARGRRATTRRAAAPKKKRRSPR